MNRLAASGLGLILLGIAMGAWGWLGHRAHQPEVLRLVMPTDPGAVMDAPFTTPVAHDYLIEFEFLWAPLTEPMRKTATATKVESEVDFQWRVEDASGATVVEGDTRWFHSIAPWRGRVGRMIDRALGRETYREPDAPTIARAVGSFRAQPGATYSLRTETGRMPAELLAGVPHATVRLNRAYWFELRTPHDAKLGVGLACLLLGGLLAIVGRVRS